MASQRTINRWHRPTFHLHRLAQSGGVVIVLLATFLVAHTDLHAGDDERLLRTALQEKKWSEVERLAQKLKVTTSLDVNLVSVYTLALMNQNKHQEAVTAATRALSLDSSRMQSWLVLAECCSRAADSKRALSLLQSTARAFPDSLQPRWALGMMYSRLGQYDQAISPLEDVMFRRNDPSVVYELAKCHFKTGQYASAAELYEVLCESYPESAQYHRAAGEALMASRKFERAIQHLEFALSKDSANPENYLLLTGALQEHGDTAKALQVAISNKDRNPNEPMAWYNLGLLRMKNHQLDSALRALKKAVSLKSNYGEAYFNLALVYQERGFVEDASNAFLRCALVSPALAPDAYNSLAIIRRRGGDLDGALQAHQQAIRLRDTSSVLHIARINSCYEAERCAVANPFIEEALGRFPDNPTVIYACCLCLIQSVQTERVKPLLEKLEKLDKPAADRVRVLMGDK